MNNKKCPPNTNCTLNEHSFLICFKCWDKYMNNSSLYYEE